MQEQAHMFMLIRSCQHWLTTVYDMYPVTCLITQLIQETDSTAGIYYAEAIQMSRR